MILHLCKLHGAKWHNERGQFGWHRSPIITRWPRRRQDFGCYSAKKTVGMIKSNAQVLLLQGGVGLQFRRGARPDNTPLFKDVMPVCDLKQMAQVLVDDKNRLSKRFQFIQAAPYIQPDQRGQALGGPVQDKQLRIVIRARAMASICCSPPDN